ncbi:MAG: hypothetical protein QOI29_2068 [Mycobacterium sp.]|nr:hypothetical protein [Mycobacterium sp.]
MINVVALPRQPLSRSQKFAVKHRGRGMGPWSCPPLRLKVYAATRRAEDG